MISFKRLRLLPAPAALLPLTLLASFLLGGCADEGAQFDVKYAPEFHKTAPTPVSILGVFREGRMSPETWDDIGARISPVFGKDSCPIGFNTRLLSDKPSLAESIDDYARENGVTDDLLDQLAPAATGDNVLVITVAGRPNVVKQATAANASTPSAGPTAQSRGMGRRGGAMGLPASMRPGAVDQNAFEMSASLFSLHDHHTIAVVSMGYAGTSGAEALQKFVAKLRESFGALPCVGWHMDAPIDEKKIKELTHEE
jgi:hypothetical protein